MTAWQPNYKAHTTVYLPRYMDKSRKEDDTSLCQIAPETSPFRPSDALFSYVGPSGRAPPLPDASLHDCGYSLHSPSSLRDSVNCCMPCVALQVYTSAMRHLSVRDEPAVRWLLDVNIDSGRLARHHVSSLQAFWPGMQVGMVLACRYCLSGRDCVGIQVLPVR